MSQNDLVISNQTFPATRADITSALQAVGSTNSGATAPTTTYANMLWYDTTANILKMRAEANDAWISVGYLDQGSDTFKILDNTVVATTAGVTAGLIGDQTTGTWQAGTGTTESLVSPAKVKASIIANVPDPIGVGQTWQDMSASRSVGTSYRNTTGRPIMVSICTNNVNRQNFQVSTNNSTWVTVGALAGYGNIGDEKSSQIIVPDAHYYRASGGSLSIWAELR
tara:strand:- start:45 stop:719 length:675 start_codon:yes stop_codon:yes gene_type:complete